MPVATSLILVTLEGQAVPHLVEPLSWTRLLLWAGTVAWSPGPQWLALCLASVPHQCVLCEGGSLLDTSSNRPSLLQGEKAQ